jgi:hypothetical protein
LSYITGLIAANGKRQQGPHWLRRLRPSR